MSRLSQINKELTTVLDFVRLGTTLFHQAKLHFGHGTDNAWDEAVFLVLYALNLPFDVDRSVMNAKLLLSEKKKIINLFNLRIKKRIPAPYLTKQAWFMGMPFYVDQRVLIPRSPIAELIEKRFAMWIDPEQVTNILDIGTGSGAIAIASAVVFPEAEVDAVDISEDALKVARQNVREKNLSDQVNLIQSDLFQKLGHKKYDIIVSNPPYVSSQELKTLPREYGFEPSHAFLGGGKHGLEVVKRILAEAKKHLKPGGILVVEVGGSSVALLKEFPQVPFEWVEFERSEDGVFVLRAE
jgi:ribosomal protein L3 glutamine methyltransferase